MTKEKGFTGSQKLIVLGFIALFVWAGAKQFDHALRVDAYKECKHLPKQYRLGGDCKCILKGTC